MKSLRYLALLPLAAAAAQAYTIEFELGKNNPSGRDNSNVVGIDVATTIGNSDFEIGANLTSFDIANSTLGATGTAYNASLDLTYNLVGTKGGIRPFVGAGLGYAWLTNDGTNNAASYKGSCMSLAAYAGVRFVLSDTLDLAFQFRNVQLLDAQVVSGTRSTLNNWQSLASLRLKF